jgi:GNAT superfamily N-acetyltransferase
MRIEVSEESMTAVAEYARIPIAFEVSEVLDVAGEPGGTGGFALSARRVGTPYVKDYDAIRREGPTQWARRFDVSKWALIAARVERQYVGGATVAYDTAGLEVLEGRSDLAVLWDIRIAPAMRRRGVGSVLFEAVEAWASAKRCRQLKVETQNINVAACRFYARHGCVLRAARRMIYSEFPEEMQLLWYKNLDHKRS